MAGRGHVFLGAAQVYSERRQNFVSAGYLFSVDIVQRFGWISNENQVRRDRNEPIKKRNINSIIVGVFFFQDFDVRHQPLRS